MTTAVDLGPPFKPPVGKKFVWDNLNGTGDYIESLFDRISIQVEGEFGGASVSIEGSNDGKHWYVLVDSQDNHMSFMYPALADVGQMSQFLRPLASGGDETAVITVTAVCKGLS